jgi:hypothetical protein
MYSEHVVPGLETSSTTKKAALMLGATLKGITVTEGSVVS